MPGSVRRTRIGTSDRPGYTPAGLQSSARRRARTRDAGHVADRDVDNVVDDRPVHELQREQVETDTSPCASMDDLVSQLPAAGAGPVAIVRAHRAVRDPQAYHDTIGAMLRTGTLLDEGMIYFDARLSRHFPTLCAARRRRVVAHTLTVE